jgi:hypothetical protein
MKREERGNPNPYLLAAGKTIINTWNLELLGNLVGM